jgi:D-alanyl-D-alanine carboxypeptidase/D-alanyl-D-alanine-endopeptidase (penicillin-binding protein 4)
MGNWHKSFLILGVVFLTIPSRSEVMLQASCLKSFLPAQSGLTEIPPSIDSEYQMNDQLKVPLASISKIFTTYWALKTYGLSHQFATDVYITKTKDQKVKVHIAGGKDPFFGRQMVYFLVSELNKRGFQNIDELTFDENFILYWEVTSFELGIQSSRAFIPSFEQVGLTLQKSIANNQINPLLYAEAREFVLKNYNLELFSQPRMFVKNIRLKTTRKFFSENKENYEQGFKLKSLPLIKYLKEMNLWSHNYVAEMLFVGVTNENLNTLDFAIAKRRSSYEMEKFLQSEMAQVEESQFEFYNGSGDSEVIGGFKKYNMGTCQSVLKMLEKLQGELKQEDLSLEHILGVSGVERTPDGVHRGTLGKRYEDFPGTIIAKTGTVNPAINLAGVLITGAGPKYFSVFMGTSSKLDWAPARDKIKEVLQGWLLSLGQDRVDYSPPVNFGLDFIPYRGVLSDLGFKKFPPLEGLRKESTFVGLGDSDLKILVNKKPLTQELWFELLENRDYEELSKRLEARDIQYINSQDERGLTALMHAAIDGNLKVVQELLRHGAKTNIQSFNNETARALALANDHQKIVEVLR